MRSNPEFTPIPGSGFGKDRGVASQLLQVLRALHAARVRGLGRLAIVAAGRWRVLHRAPVPMNDGRVLYLDLRDPWCIAYLLTGEIPYERGETRFVHSVVKPGDAVIDAGAFVGWYSTLLAELVGSNGRVYAFEPNEPVYDLLAESAKGYPVLEVIRAALGDQIREASLYVPFESNKASLAPPPFFRSARGCEMTTLDEFLESKERPVITFVKCDVEGAELKVLGGATRLLRSAYPPLWMMEMNPMTVSRFGHHVEAMMDTFHAMGYSAFKISSETGYLQPLTEVPNCVLNAAFVPAWLQDRVEPIIR